MKLSLRLSHPETRIDTFKEVLPRECFITRGSKAETSADQLNQFLLLRG